jgi:hypothetical protein
MTLQVGGGGGAVGPSNMLKEQREGCLCARVAASSPCPGVWDGLRRPKLNQTFMDSDPLPISPQSLTVLSFHLLEQVVHTPGLSKRHRNWRRAPKFHASEK